jgi:hypothetical protein
MAVPFTPQGLLSRPDWDAARRVPIAHVPGGSGNGLAHSCGLRDPHTAAFSICKAVVSPMDVASVLQPPASRQYIMLSVAYGSLANLDINTERFRWMGDLRFTLGAVWVSACLEQHVLMMDVSCMMTQDRVLALVCCMSCGGNSVYDAVRQDDQPRRKSQDSCTLLCSAPAACLRAVLLMCRRCWARVTSTQPA